MSHTNKTDPYWVRLNHRKTVNTWHRHDLIGKTYYTRRYLYDEKGQPITHEEPVKYKAWYIVKYGPWNPDKFTTPFMKQAKELVGAGKGDEYIQIGTRTVREFEEIEHRYSDHCTEGEPLTSRNRWGQGMTCTPDFPYNDPSFWGGGYTSRKATLKKVLNGAERSRARKNLRTLTKAANTPETCWDREFADDYEEAERMTDQHRHNGKWLAW